MGPGPEPEPISFSACSCLSLLPPSFCLSPHPSHLVFLSLGSSPAGVSDPLRLTISLKPSSTFQPNIKALSLLPSPTPPPPAPILLPGLPVLHSRQASNHQVHFYFQPFAHYSPRPSTWNFPPPACPSPPTPVVHFWLPGPSSRAWAAAPASFFPHRLP